jgi:Tfp pilus assembly protein PilO
MSYTPKDLERARVFLNHYLPDDTDVAQLIADVRREALEEAAEFAEQYIGAHPALVERIRALKDGDK